MEQAERTREFLRCTAERRFAGEQRCFAACADSLAGRHCACNPEPSRYPEPSRSDESATAEQAREWWAFQRFDPCDFACGPTEDGNIVFVKACPVHGMIDLSKGWGHITPMPKNSIDATIEAQSKLLACFLKAASVDIVDDYVAFAGGFPITPDEEILLRLLLTAYAQ
jgi:hypothetical protein